LLASDVKISGVTKQGLSVSTAFSFNATADYSFKPIFEKIRHAEADITDAVQSSEPDKFNLLIRSNFKLMNYARSSLLAGEKVICFIVQPEIQLPVLNVLGWTFHRTISPTYISILTDHELIMICEGDPQNKSTGRYGGICTYIPLNKIESLNSNRQENGLLVLSIQLLDGVRLENIYQDSAKQELDKLISQFSELTSKPFVSKQQAYK
jgi:hypothetical protein